MMKIQTFLPPDALGLVRLRYHAATSQRLSRLVLNIIKVEGLTKRYARTVAVDNISFEVEKGQIVGFLGPNGAGKTTTMRVLTCFLPPTSGTANVAGYDVLEQPMEVKKRIGYLPETPPLYPEMEVREYLEFVGRIKGVPAANLAKRVAEVSEKCAVAEV